MTVYELDITYRPVMNLSSLSKVTTSKEVDKYLRSIWNNKLCSKESFYILLLNTSSKIIGFNCHSIGHKTSTLVDISEVCLYAITYNAKNVIISHNHPSGNLNPSEADKELTLRISNALDLFNIRLLDHVILTPESYYSFSDNGIF